MKKNQNGFFLAETIIVLALVTTIMAFVYPNVSKLYDNYKTRIDYYDQTEDIILLYDIYRANRSKITKLTEGCCGDSSKTSQTACNSGSGVWMKGAKIINGNLNNDLTGSSHGLILPEYGSGKQYNEIHLYLYSYMENPTVSGDYSFNRYLRRIKKSSNDVTAYRLIGKFKIDKGNDKYIYRYANVKIVLSHTCGANF